MTPDEGDGPPVGVACGDCDACAHLVGVACGRQGRVSQGVACGHPKVPMCGALSRAKRHFPDTSPPGPVHDIGPCPRYTRPAFPISIIGLPAPT